MPSKYSSGDHRRRAEAPTGPHPIWNTLGCIMLVVIPIMSIAIASLVVQMGLSGGWPIPAALLRPIILPDWIYAAPGLAFLLVKIVSVDYLLAYIVLSIIFIVLLGGLVSVLYAFIHSIAGPPKYGPLDAKPIKSKPYKR